MPTTVTPGSRSSTARASRPRACGDVGDDDRRRAEAGQRPGGEDGGRAGRGGGRRRSRGRRRARPAARRTARPAPTGASRSPPGRSPSASAAAPCPGDGAAGDVPPVIGRSRRPTAGSCRASGPAWRARAAAVTSASSNGSTAPPTYCPVSCPLPATSTTSPFPARPAARSIAAARSGSMITRARSPCGTPSTPCSISPRIASGSSERGLSLVKIGHVGQPGGGRAHQRALAPVPVAAAAEHHDQFAAGHLAQRGQHGLDRAGLVRVVDERVRPQAAAGMRDPLQAGRARRGRRRRRPPRRPGPRPPRPAPRSRPGRWPR